jgi:PTS system beta-glucosides-specific IIC component
MNYQELASSILKNLGGADNITKIWHCATRLRVEVVDDAVVNRDSLEALNGVIKVVCGHGQYQIVIGAQVGDVFDEIAQLDGMEDKQEKSNGEQPSDASKEMGKKGFGGLIDRFITFISGIFMPFLGAIVGAGVLKGFLALAVALNWMSEASGTYLILSAAGDAIFYFLPIFVAYSVATELHADHFVSMSVAGALVYPDIVALVTNGTTTDFLGIPVIAMSYSGSVIPAILAILVLSYLERLLKKVIPEALRYVFVPMISLVIMVPLTLVAVGPIASTISTGLADGIIVLYNFAPWAVGILLGAFWQVIVIFGFHWMILPLMMNNITVFGSDPLLPITCAAVVSQCGAALGVFLKTKNMKMKEVAGSAFISAFFGITEPTLYGVTLKLKKPFYFAIASSAIGGAVIGFAGVGAKAFTFPSFLSLPTYLGTGFIGEIIGLVIAFFGGAVLTYLFGVNDSLINIKEPAE